MDRVNPCVGSTDNRVYAARAQRRHAARMLREAEMHVQRAGYVEAISRAEQVLRSDPAHLGALETLARAQWKAGLHQPLLETLRSLIGLNPYEPGYHALRGAALQCLGRYGEASQALARAGAMPEAEANARELDSWQAELIADMARQDPVLRAHLEQSPTHAYAARGFRLPARPTPLHFPQRAERPQPFQRPS